MEILLGKSTSETEPTPQLVFTLSWLKRKWQNWLRRIWTTSAKSINYNKVILPGVLTISQVLWFCMWLIDFIHKGVNKSHWCQSVLEILTNHIVPNRIKATEDPCWVWTEEIINPDKIQISISTGILTIMPVPRFYILVKKH